MIIYGYHAVKSLVAHQSHFIKNLWIAQPVSRQAQDELVAFFNQHQLKPHWVKDKAKLDKRAESSQHQGWVAEVRVPPFLNNTALHQAVEEAERPPFYLMLDEIQDPHNFGAILRTAEGAGVDGVIMGKNRQVGLTPVVVKVASGAAFQLKIYQVNNLAQTMKHLQKAGLWFYALDERGSESVFSADLTSPLCVLMGAEGKGLKASLKSRADFLLSIPMAGVVESLNVSVATGIALYSVVASRQKN